jgi:small-conductance mechanosensitive channel
MMAGCLARVSTILTSPPAEVGIKRFDGRQVTLQALFWHAPSLQEGRRAVTDAGRAILAAFADAGIELAAPRALMARDESTRDGDGETH